MCHSLRALLPLSPLDLKMRTPFLTGGEGSTKMTIEEAIHKATERGYHIHGSDGVATSYIGANDEYSAWTRIDNDSTFMVPIEETFLDPAFWYALGRALGHAKERRTGTLALRSPAGNALCKKVSWATSMLRFIDHLAEGKDPESFFATLSR